MAKAADAHVDWRATAHPDDLAEYDRFGPWVDAVRTVDDMPKFFRSHYPEHHDARFLLKIPKRVDRAQARQDAPVRGGARRSRGSHLPAHGRRRHHRPDGCPVVRGGRAEHQQQPSGQHLDAAAGRWPVAGVRLQQHGPRTHRRSHRVRPEPAPGTAGTPRRRTLEVPKTEDFFRSSLLTLRQSSLRPVVPSTWRRGTGCAVTTGDGGASPTGS